MNEIQMALGALATTVGFAVFEPPARRSGEKLKRYWERRDQREAKRTQENAAGEKPDESPASTELEQPPAAIPGSQTAAFYWKQLVNDGGVLGMLTAPAAGAFGLINSKLIAEGMETVLNRAGYVLTTISLWGDSFDLTDHHLFGAAFGIGQFLLGAELAERFKEKGGMRWLVLLGAALPLIILEDFISGWRGYVLGGVVLAVVNALLAHVAAMVELLAGYRGIHLLAVPLIKALFWSLVAPLRWCRRCLAKSAAKKAPNKPEEDLDKPGFFTYVGALIDFAVYAPLRNIEAMLTGWFRRNRS